ncbi:MAG: PRD domain-containing protein [Lachnospiraceae bacterium]|nr:PRD domain-containing protein [Lachnospiraceae bacterium]
MNGNKFRVISVINNNVIVAINERHQERILTGKGIGFQMKKGNSVDPAKIEKEYYLKSKNISGKLYALLAQTPEIYMEITSQIIKRAENVLGKSLDESIYLNLIDHVNFAVTRLKQGIAFKNILLWEIIHFYPQEYEVGLYALELLQEKVGYQLPQDEAGTIAMHIVNAEYDTKNMQDTMKMTELIHKAINLIRYQYHMNFDEESVHYVRFITHLKFFASRLFTDKMLDDPESGLRDLIGKSYPEAYACAEKIAKLIWNDYQLAITEDEVCYLAVHIRRITMQS